MKDSIKAMNFICTLILIKAFVKISDLNKNYTNICSSTLMWKNYTVWVIGNHFIFLMPKVFWSDRWRYHSQWPVSQLWFSAVDSTTVASQKCDYEINSVPSLVHFQHKKDQVTPNWQLFLFEIGWLVFFKVFQMIHSKKPPSSSSRLPTSIRTTIR